MGLWPGGPGAGRFPLQLVLPGFIWPGLPLHCPASGSVHFTKVWGQPNLGFGVQPPPGSVPGLSGNVEDFLYTKLSPDCVFLSQVHWGPWTGSGISIDLYHV